MKKTRKAIGCAEKATAIPPQKAAEHYFASFELNLKDFLLPSSINLARIRKFQKLLTPLTAEQDERIAKLLFISIFAYNDADATCAIFLSKPHIAKNPVHLGKIPFFQLMRMMNFLVKSQALAQAGFNDAEQHAIAQAIENNLFTRLSDQDVSLLLHTIQQSGQSIFYYLYSESVAERFLQWMTKHPSFHVATETLQQMWPIAIQYQIKALAKYALSKKLLTPTALSVEQVIAGNWSPLSHYVLLFCSPKKEEAKAQVVAVLERYFFDPSFDEAKISDHAAFDLLALFYWLSMYAVESLSPRLKMVFEQLKKKLSGKPLKALTQHTLSGMVIGLHLTYQMAFQESLTADDALYYLLQWPDSLLFTCLHKFKKFSAEQFLFAIWRKLNNIDASDIHSINVYLELLHYFLTTYPEVQSISKLQLNTFVLLAIKVDSLPCLEVLARCSEFREIVGVRFAAIPFFTKFNASGLSPIDFACRIQADACAAWLYHYFPEARDSLNDLLSILHVLINTKAIKSIKELLHQHPALGVTEGLAALLYPLCADPSLEESLALAEIIAHVPLENYTPVMLAQVKPPDMQWLEAVDAALVSVLAKQTHPDHKRLAAAHDAIAYHLRIQAMHQEYYDEDILYDPFDLAYQLYQIPPDHRDRPRLVEEMRKTLIHCNLNSLRKEKQIKLNDGRSVHAELIRFFCVLEEAEEFLALIFARAKRYQFTPAVDTIDPLLVAVEQNKPALFALIAARTPRITAVVYFALLQRDWSPTEFSGFYSCVFEHRKIMMQLLENFPTTYSVNSYFELLVFCHNYKKWNEQNKVVLLEKNPINKIKMKLEELLRCKFSDPDKDHRMLSAAIATGNSVVIVTVMELMFITVMPEKFKAQLAPILYADPHHTLFETGQLSAADFAKAHDLDVPYQQDMPVQNFILAFRQSIAKEEYGKAKRYILLLTKFFQSAALPYNPYWAMFFLEYVGDYYQALTYRTTLEQQQEADVLKNDIFCEVLRFDLSRLPRLAVITNELLGILRKVALHNDAVHLDSRDFFHCIDAAYQEKLSVECDDPVKSILYTQQTGLVSVSVAHAAMIANKNKTIPKGLALVQACEVFFTGLLDPGLRNALMDHIESLLQAPGFDPNTITLSLLESICNYTNLQPLFSKLLQARIAHQPPLSEDQITTLFGLVCHHALSIADAKRVLALISPYTRRFFFPTSSEAGHCPIALYWHCYPHQVPLALVRNELVGHIKKISNLKECLMSAGMLNLVQFLALVRELRQDDATLLETEQLILRIMEKKSINYLCYFATSDLNTKFFASLCLDEADFLKHLRGQDIKRIIAAAILTANLKLFCIILKFLDLWQIDCDFYDDAIWYVTATENNKISLLSQLMQILDSQASSSEMKSNAYGIVVLLLSRIDCARLSAAEQKMLYACVALAIYLPLPENLSNAQKLLAVAKLDDSQCVSLIKTKKSNMPDELLIIILNQISAEAQQQLALGKVRCFKELRPLIELTKKSFGLNAQCGDTLRAVCLFLIQQMLSHQDFKAIVKKLSLQELSELSQKTKQLSPALSEQLQVYIDAQFVETKLSRTKAPRTNIVVMTKASKDQSHGAAAFPESLMAREELGCEESTESEESFARDGDLADSALSLTDESIASSASEGASAANDLLVVQGFTPSCLLSGAPNKEIYETILGQLAAQLGKIGLPCFVFGSFNYKVRMRPQDIDILILIGEKEPELEKIFSEAALPMEKISDYRKKTIDLHILRFRYTGPQGSTVEIDFSMYRGSLHDHTGIIDYTVTVYYDFANNRVYVPHVESLTHIQNKVLYVQNNLETLIAANALFLFRMVKLIALEEFSISPELEQALTEYSKTKGDFFEGLKLAHFTQEFQSMFFYGYGVRHFEVLMQLRLFEYLFPTVRALPTLQDRAVMHQLILCILSDQDQQKAGVPHHPLVLFYATHHWPRVHRQSDTYEVEALARDMTRIDPSVCLNWLGEKCKDTSVIVRYVDSLRSSIFAKHRKSNVAPNGFSPFASPARAVYSAEATHPPFAMSPYPMFSFSPMAAALPPPPVYSMMGQRHVTEELKK